MWFEFKPVKFTPLTCTMAYVTGASHTTGVVNIARIDQPHTSESGTGSFSFSRTNADNLLLASGELNLADNSTLGYRADSDFKRAGNTYRGLITCTNGSPGTLDDRYRPWLWVIKASDDRDRNGIPDFSDVASAFPPVLQLQVLEGQLTLRISGEPDATYTVQSAITPNAAGWSGGVPVVVGTNGGVLFPGAATELARFWRALYP